MNSPKEMIKAKFGKKTGTLSITGQDMVIPGDILRTLGIPRDEVEIIHLHDVERLESRAFADCPNLRRVRFVQGLRPSKDLCYQYRLRFIGSHAFADCPRLCEFEFSPEDSVTEIEEGAFCGCESLHLAVRGFVETIGKDAFRGVVLKSINLEDDVDLDTDAFRGCFIEVLKVSEGSEDHFERLLEGNCLGIGRFGRKDVPRN